MEVVEEDALAIVVMEGPLTCVHTPVPMTAVLAAMVAEEAQMTWSLPAAAMEGLANTLMRTISVLGVQLLKVTVH